MIRKRDYFNSVVGQDRRIHDDVLSLNHDEFWEVSQDPYFASSTAVIFLTRGSLRISINMTDFVCAEAKALLRSTSMSIEQISDTLSFPNQSLFGKYFKRITGMSPRQYRNSTK